MIFLDVVYNHFGPDGNYLAAYAPSFFRDDIATPWGAAIDFRRPEVRRFFTENALYWLMEYRFDGLRFDAVHAIAEPDWLDEMAARGPRHRRAGPPCPSGARARRQRRRPSARSGFDAQWNDDGHHVLHVAADRRGRRLLRRLCRPAGRAAGALPRARASSTRASPRRYRKGEPRGTPSADLPPTAFVLFLQNHDQIGNRAVRRPADRRASIREALEAAIALQLLCPQIPLHLHGRGGRQPHALPVLHRPSRRARRGGARRPAPRVRELRGFPIGETANDPRSQRARRPSSAAARVAERRRQARACIAGCSTLRAAASRAAPCRRARRFGAGASARPAVAARWRLGDGAVLTLVSNLGRDRLRGRSAGRAICCSRRAPAQRRRSRRPARRACAPSPSWIPRAMNEEAVLARARTAGIAVDWTDAMGRPQRVRTDSLRRILEALDWHAMHRSACRRCVTRARSAAPIADPPASTADHAGRAGAGGRRRRRPFAARATARCPASGGWAIIACASPIARSRWPSRRRAASPCRTSAAASGCGAWRPRSTACAAPAMAASATPARVRELAEAAARHGADAMALSPVHSLFPARSGALRPLLAVEPAVPQSALRRSLGDLRRRRRRYRRRLGARSA